MSLIPKFPEASFTSRAPATLLAQRFEEGILHSQPGGVVGRLGRRLTSWQITRQGAQRFGTATPVAGLVELTARWSAVNAGGQVTCSISDHGQSRDVRITTSGDLSPAANKIINATIEHVRTTRV